MDYTYPYIRPAIRQALEAYLLNHRPIGGFLQACLANDLRSALARADYDNKSAVVLQDIVWFIANELPGPAHDYRAWTTCMCAESLPPGAMIVVGPDDKYQGKNPNCLVHTWTPER